jgi:hypothetical protein
MTKQPETPKAEPAIRELSAAEMQQAGGGAVIVHERSGRRGIVVHE